MRGLDPRIHVFALSRAFVDGRDEPGYDEYGKPSHPKKAEAGIEPASPDVWPP